MKLSELFLRDAMALDLDTTSKDDTLQLLAQRFADTGGVADVAGYVANLQKREAQSTTGVGDEIAIPHAQHPSITSPAIIFARSNNGVEWASFDGQPAKLIFMIAAPEGGSNVHLQALANLSKVLMNPEAKAALSLADSPEKVVSIIAQFEESEEEAPAVAAAPVAETNGEAPYILAVTACPTGIAHTFMAEEKLKQAGKAAGVRIKVETNGQAGVGNRLTADDIANATAIIVAADKQVDMNRFNGKPVIITKVADGINKADELVARAVKADAPIYQATGNSDATVESTGNESLGRKFYKHLMNGVSHMLPFVVAGGILIAISFFWGINSSKPGDPSYNALAESFFAIGKIAFALMLPVLAGFIGQSIADRPGLVLGFVGGVLANPTEFSAFPTEGAFKAFRDTAASGFLGALVAGFLAGAIVYFLRIAFAWLPKSLEGLKPIFLFPVFGVAIMGFLMLYVVNAPMASVMTALKNFLSSMSGGSKLFVGLLVGAMMSIDMGGPVNKAAYVTGTALLTSSSEGSDVMAAVMVGGMVPPLAIALAATFNRNLWPKEERNGAMVNYVMGAAFITEGAIPFAAANPLLVIPSLVAASGIAGAISITLGAVSKVPHGGLFAVLAGGIANPAGFMIAWLVGGVLGALFLNIAFKYFKK